MNPDNANPRILTPEAAFIAHNDLDPAAFSIVGLCPTFVIDNPMPLLKPNHSSIVLWYGSCSHLRMTIWKGKRSFGQSVHNVPNSMRQSIARQWFSSTTRRATRKRKFKHLKGWT